VQQAVQKALGEADEVLIQGAEASPWHSHLLSGSLCNRKHMQYTNLNSLPVFLPILQKILNKQYLLQKSNLTCTMKLQHYTSGLLI